MDEGGRIICEVRYEKFLPYENQWLVYKTFFEQGEEEVIEYAFDSELESSCEAKINAIHFIQKKNGFVTAKSSLYWGGKYVETFYRPQPNDTLFVKEKMWDGLYAEREYTVYKGAESLVVTDITAGQAIQVYPEKAGHKL